MSGGKYTRHTAQNARVVYDSAGRHEYTQTVDRHVTRFEYAGSSDTLMAILLPVASSLVADSLAYRFDYVNDSTVTITAPGARMTTLRKRDGRLTHIIDPDGDTTRFEYGWSQDSLRISKLWDRAGSWTEVQYDATSRRIASVHYPYGGSVTFAHAEARGLFPTDPDSAFTEADGPRTDVRDVTRYWINGFGAVTRVRDALGHETRVRYSSSWPGLPERTEGPTRLQTIASYDSLGRTLSVRVPAPYGNTADTSVTEYEWHATLNRVITVTSRTQGTTMQVQEAFGYASDSSLSWSQRGDSLTRVAYSYVTTGTGARLPESVTLPGAATTTYQFDGLGNLTQIASPEGRISGFTNDAVGRTVSSLTPSGVRTSHWFDVLNRDTLQVVASPNVTLSTGRTAFGDTIRVRMQYDAVGRMVANTRYYTRHHADTATAGYYALEPSLWAYDSLGRVDSSKEAGRGWTKRVYDAAGNVISVRSPRSHTTVMKYDALNRLVRSIAPEVTYGSSDCEWIYLLCSYAFPTLEGSSLCIATDTAFFEYDRSGGMRVADNNWARIRRKFAPNGALLSERQIIRGYDTEAEYPCGPGDRHAGWLGPFEADWASNSYELHYTYDLLGRRLTMSYPNQLDSCIGTCVQHYAYNARGELSATAHPTASGDTVWTTFSYDDAGRLVGTAFPGAVAMAHTYDKDNQLVARSGTDVSETYARDAGGRLTSADLWADTAAFEYSGMGALVRAGGLTPSLVEEFRTDALGSTIWTRDAEMLDGINRTRVQLHNTSTGQLNAMELATRSSGSCPLYDQSCHPLWYIYAYDQEFDASGNVWRSYEIETDPSTQAQTPTETRHYYDAAERLTFSNTMYGWIVFEGWGTGTFSEYRYDALGRRVLTRTRRIGSCAAPCDAFIERTVHDGNQVLVEMRSSGQIGISSLLLNADGYAAENGSNAGGSDAYKLLFGVVLYVHANGIDDPVHVLKRSPSHSWTAFTPLKDWRGLYFDGRLTNGDACSAITCPVDWLSGTVSAYGREVGFGPPHYSTWYGSLLRGRKDANGLTYLRNRYYDATTGRFTQQDPIGLAGGLNLYGYAGGDPINFSDPFGLCPYNQKEPDTNVDDCPDDAVGRGVRLLRSEGGTTGASTIRLMAANNARVRVLSQGALDRRCGRSGSTGCNDGRTIYMIEGASEVDMATRLTHEATHYFSRPYSQEEPLAWRRALTVFRSLDGALPAAQTAGSWYRPTDDMCRRSSGHPYCP